MVRSNNREKEQNRKRAREKRQAKEPVEKKKKKVKKILAKYKQGKAELFQHLEEMSKHGKMLDEEVMGMVEDEEVKRVIRGHYNGEDEASEVKKNPTVKTGDNNNPSGEEVVDNNN